MVNEAAALAVAPLESFITPSTFPKLVLEPTFVPTSPVMWDNPVLLTAPFAVYNAKLEVVPKTGAWAIALVAKKTEVDITTMCKSFFIKTNN